MAGPFDFLQGVGKDISGAENSIGGWLKGLLPSQPAQPQNPPLTAPSVSATPLAGMAPTGGVSMSRPVVPQNTGRGLGFLLQHPGDFAAETGLTNLGQDLMNTDLSKTQTSQDLAAPFNDPNSAISKIGEALPAPGFLIPGARERMIANAGIDPNSWGGKVLKDPFGYVANVLNAGVVSPTQLAANPEMWFAEDNNKASLVGAIDQANFGTGSGGHNYLRDIFAPALKAVTGEDVPPPTTSFEPQAKELQAEQQQLLQAQQQLDNNPNRSQQEIDAFNARLAEYQAHFDKYMSSYNKSADWWQNSNTSKTLSLIGQAVTFPAGFAEGLVTFMPQLFQNPEGAAEGVYSQVQQAAKFVGTLANPQARDHMTAQELTANLSNIAMLSGLLLGPKLLHKGGTADDLATRNDMLKGVIQNDRGIVNPEAGQVANAAKLADARAQAPEPPEEIRTRIVDLQMSLKTAQQHLHEENDPVMKRTLIEQVSGLTDEIRNLQDQPRQLTGHAPVPFRMPTSEELVANGPLRGGHLTSAADIEQNFPEGVAQTAQARLDRMMAEEGAVDATAREKIGERGLSETFPEVQPTSVREDLYSPSTKVLGPNYQHLEPRPEDFSLNVRGGTNTEAERFARSSPTELRAYLQGTRFQPTKLERLGGNGWITPDGLAIPISNYDYTAHEEFFSASSVPGEDLPRVMMDNGWVKKSNIAGMVNFGVRGLTPKSLDLISKAIISDHAKGEPPYPYQVADELTGRPAVEISWQEFAANNFDIAPTLARAERNPELYGARTTRPQSVDDLIIPRGKKASTKIDLENITPKQQASSIDAAAAREGSRIDRNPNDITYGFIAPDGRGIRIDPNHLDNTHNSFYFNFTRDLLGRRNYTQREFQRATKGFVEIRQELPSVSRRLGDKGIRLNLSAHDSSGKKLAEDYLLKRAETKPDKIHFNWIYFDEDGNLWRQDAEFNYQDFVDNGFQLNNKLFRRGSMDSTPSKVPFYDEMPLDDDRLYARLPQGQDRLAGDRALWERALKVIDTIDQLNLSAMANRLGIGREIGYDRGPEYYRQYIKASLQRALGEKLGTQISGEAGQAGTPNTTSEGWDRPEGTPEGTRLTATLEGTEGQKPLGVWEANAQPAGTVSDGRGTVELAKKALKDAVVEAFSTSPFSRGEENARLQQTILDGIKKEIDAIPPEEIQKQIVRRDREFKTTFNKVRGKYDPEGYVTSITYDHKTDFDAYFWDRNPRSITYNPLKLITTGWAHYIADVTNKFAVVELKEDLTPEQYDQLTGFVKQWTKVTQEQLDENTAAEEIGHAYDRDHLNSIDEYLRMIIHNTSDEWKAAAYQAGLGLSDGGFDNSIFGWLQRYINNPESVPESIKMHLNTQIAEYRASSFKVWKGAPLAGYTYRVGEVFRNEIKDPSLIQKAAQAFGRDFESRLRPRLRQWIDSQTARNQPTFNAASQQGGVASSAAGTGASGIREGAPAGDVMAPTSATPATGLSGRDTGDQESLGVRKPPSENKGFMSPEEWQIVQKTITPKAIEDLTTAGWPEGVRWENFARALMDPKDKAYPIVKGILDKMPPKTASVFVRAGESLTRESIQTGIRPEPRLKGPAIADARVQEELAPETRASEEANPEEVEAKINDPRFQYIRQQIAAAEVKIREAGPIIDKMTASGEAQYKIDTEKAGLAGLRAFTQALKDGELYQNAVKIGRDAKVREALRLEAAQKASSPLPELDEEPYNGIFLGKKYGNFNVDVAKKITQRLQWSGYRLPKDKAGNLGFNDFLDGLFGEDRVAEKSYKALPATFKEYIKEKTGYQGVPKRGKNTKGAEPAPVREVAPGTEHYINQTDFEGLEKAIAVVPQQGGFISIRHGSTARNGGSGGDERLRGQDDIPLNDQGEQQAERLAAAFKGMNVSVIYVSPMKRAVDTANAIAKTTGAKVVIDKNLGPQDIGDYAGKPADVYGKLLAEQAVNNPDEKTPNGESRNDYLKRFLPAVRKHMDDALTKDGITLEINHTTGNRTIKGYVMAGGNGLDVHPDPILNKEEVGPGGITGYKFENGRWQVASATLKKKTGYNEKGEEVWKSEFVSGEASQKFDVQEGEKGVAPKSTAPAREEDPVVAEIKKDVKTTQTAEKKAAKIKGEIAPKSDLSTQIDAAAADPAHPANAAAVDAKTLRDLLPKAEEMGGAAYERIKTDYAIALQRFTSRMAMTAKDAPRAAEITKPKVTDQKLFDHTASIAAQLRKKIDKGADLNDVAEEAAKKIGMTLKQAQNKIKDGTWGDRAAKNWAPAYKDLILGKPGQVVREARLSNKALQPALPIDIDELLGSKDSEKPVGPTAPPKPAGSRPQRRTKAANAVANTLRRSSPPRETPKEVSGDKIFRDARKKVDENLTDNAKKDTKTLRDEVDEIHKEINTPSPNIFAENLTRQIRENMKEIRNERRRSGLEEPGMGDPAGGDGGDEPPPKPPGNVMAGWNDAFEPARSHEDLKDIANRMDEFLKALSKRVNPGRNTAHPVMQAKDINDHAVSDEYRRDGLMKALDDYIGKDIERHRRLRRAIEGPEDARLEARKLLTPEEGALADMWHAHEDVLGRIKTLPDRQLIKSMAEDHLAHVLKFNENGEELLDKKGHIKTAAMGSTKVKSWINRVVDEDTGLVKWPTIDSLIDAFGEKNVEENLVKIFKASTDSFLRKMRTKEMIDDLSGHYISTDKAFRQGIFREKEITPGVGGRGLQKGDAPYQGFAIVKEGKAYDKMDPAYKDQLRRIKIGPYGSQLENYWVYKPLAEQLERYAGLEEAMEGWNSAANVFQKANAIYKLYKFGYNPLHLFNLHFNMVAMGNKWDPTGLSLYSRVFGDVNKLINNEMIWKTPIGDFNGDEGIAKIIGAGAVVRKEIVDTASLGEFQDFFAKLPLGKQWHNFMWHEVAWKMQLGLAKLKTDQLTRAFQREFKRPVNEAEFDNILKLSVHNAKQAVGFLDKADMSRNWRTIAGTAYFANSWSTLQARLLGRALPQGLPGAKWLANLGGGERYTNVITTAMKEAGMEPETLKWINSQDAAMARTFAVGGALKLLAMTTALAYGGSYLATLTGQPNARVAGPAQNFLRDPTHTFDIYLGTDPATGKDKWQHNPTYGMIQEMMLYGMAAVKAQREGKSTDQILEAALGRYGFGKANPVLDQTFDQISGRNNALAFLGYGDKANISEDPAVVALHRALDAKGVPDLGGLEDRLIYAWRSVGPMPSFAPTVKATDQLNTWGDISKAMGTGQYFGAGDLWNFFDSSSPQFGKLENVTKFDLGNIAQYVLGSRQTLSTTPQEVALNKQYAQNSADRTQKDQAEQQMAQAAYKGDWQTVLTIGNQLNYDNNQMLNALEHPPSGSGGGILYHGTPFTSGNAAPSQDTLQGYTLTTGQTTELESLKKINTVAMYTELAGSPEWQNAPGSARAAMLSSMEGQVMKAVENQYAQQIGLMGGAPITNGDIQQLISTEIGLRSVAGGVIATNNAYTSTDPIQQQRMMTEYKTFADTLAWDSTFGSLKGVPPERIQSILDATIQVEEGTRDYLKGSIFYQMGTPSDQVRMLTEYSSLARTIAKRYALGQGQGPRGNIQLDPKQIMPTLQKTIGIEETAKSLLHGTDYYQTADQATQVSLDDKYARLARTMAFSQVPTGDPESVINNSIMAEESYFDLQNQFGGGNYVKLMAQQLSDIEATFRMSASYTPKQISAMQRAIRADFLDKNPAYAQYLKAKTWWGKNTTDGQIYKAMNNSEFSAVDDLSNSGGLASNSILLSGTSSDPYFDPASNMSLVDLGQGNLSSAGVGLGSNPLSLDQMTSPQG